MAKSEKNGNLLEVGGRLRQLATTLGVSQATLAEQAGIPASSLKTAITGRNLPGFATLASLKSQYPTLNINWLITGEGEMFTDHKLALPNAIQPIVVDPTGRELIMTVPARARAGYAQNADTPQVVGYMEGAFLPFYKAYGEDVMFEVEGDSMEPLMHTGDYVMTTRVRDGEDVRDGGLYVIVRADGLYIKRVLNGDGVLVLLSENLSYEYLTISVRDVYQVWEIKRLWTGHLPMSAGMGSLISKTKSLMNGLRQAQRDFLNSDGG